MTLAYHIVIPARLASSRLPRKPLLDVAGKPLIERVWDVAKRSGAADVVVATEDREILEVVEAFGGDAIMTSADHESGTDRLAEVVTARKWPADDIVVNLQGDEPKMPPDLLDAAAELLDGQPEAGIATFATPIRSVNELFDPGVVKVVGDANGLALYFSRAVIPWHREGFSQSSRPTQLPRDVPFLRHLGLYSYRADTLRRFSELPASALEQAEKLEQLRALGAGIRIALGLVETPPGHGVDTPEDLERVRGLFIAEDR